MTERRKLKKELRKLRYVANSLPRLIDCSKVYGDEYFTEQDTEEINRKISEIENKLKMLP